MTDENTAAAAEPAASSNGTTPPDPVKTMLTEFLAREDLRAITVGFLTKDGSAGVRMTPMPPIEANHLSRILDVRVQREYTQTLFAGQAARPPSVQPGGKGTPAMTPKELQVLAQALQRKKGQGKKARKTG